MKQNNYYLFAKIIGCLLLLFVIVTIVYGCASFSNGDDLGSSLNINKNEESKKYTEIIKVSDICESGKDCSKESVIKFNDNKSVTMNFNRKTNEDGSVTDSLTIDGNEINLSDAKEVYEFGILKSKYYVVSYMGEAKTFYYLDELYRDVKKVSHVDLDTDASSLNYNYYACKSSDEAMGGIVKNDYTMMIDDNGTLMSSITNTTEGTCE